MENRDGFYINDDLLFAPLDQIGWSVEEVPWTSTSTNWKLFDAVIIRSTWDYQNHPDQFLSVIHEIESHTNLFNSAQTCRWNLDKRYLADLQGRDIPIVPTQWQSCLSESALNDSFSFFDTQKLVVKPTIGANADDTFVLAAAEPEGWQTAINTFVDRPHMVQPFLSSIVKHGEYSLFYFGGKFSHAILKKPKQNDFRVQEEHGGTIEPIHVDLSLSDLGAKLIDAIDDELLYARVDLVLLADRSPAVIELELIEPSLYFNYSAESPERFVEAFERMMKRA